jgi:hypothetical protein
LRWLLVLEEYGVKFEYLSEQKNLASVTDDLSRLDIDSLKFQEEEEVVTLLSGSENKSSINIEFTILTALIFKSHTSDKGLSQSNLEYRHYPNVSPRHIPGIFTSGSLHEII